MEQRRLNMIFTKGGSGSVSTKVSIPKKWVDALGITADEKEIMVVLEDNQIVIKKAEQGFFIGQGDPDAEIKFERFNPEEKSMGLEFGKLGEGKGFNASLKTGENKGEINEH